jgi:hypothetical protein
VQTVAIALWFRNCNFVLSSNRYSTFSKKRIVGGGFLFAALKLCYNICMSTGKSGTGKVIGLLALIVLIVVAFYIYKGNTITTVNTNTEEKKDATAEVTPVTITRENIKEENFSGVVARISGTDTASTEAQKYIDNTVSEFRTQADKDVPDMRKQFGADSPTANYTIDVGAKVVESAQTESVVISVYSYTGGAHGNSIYKVITASKASGQISSLSDVIKDDQQAAFTEFVKQALKAWAPAGSTAPVVFPEDVDNLKFESFTNWSLDEENLTLYFSQYDIGPGVLGPVAFPLPLTKLKDFLK